MSVNTKVLDTEVLDDLKAAIGDSLPRIIKLYISDTPNTLQQMQQALQKDDLNTVKRLAHSLKSSSANVGAMQVSSLAIDLETVLNSGETDNTKLLSAINAIQAAFDQVSHMLSPYV